MNQNLSNSAIMVRYFSLFLNHWLQQYSSLFVPIWSFTADLKKLEPFIFFVFLMPWLLLLNLLVASIIWFILNLFSSSLFLIFNACFNSMITFNNLMLNFDPLLFHDIFFRVKVPSWVIRVLIYWTLKWVRIIFLWDWLRDWA